MNYSNLRLEQDILIKKFVDLHLTKRIPFDGINLPSDKKGVYFIYEGDTLLYIGSAYKNKRTLKLRLSQYLQPKNSGATFTKHYMRHKAYKNTQITIDKIKINCEVSFIKFNLTENMNHILGLEYDCISLYKPILNY